MFLQQGWEVVLRRDVQGGPVAGPAPGGVDQSFQRGIVSVCVIELCDRRSRQAMQVIVKETLAGRKNLTAQNNYETNQLYAAGALKVACIGLQCVGFNEGLYRGLLDHAAACAQGTVKRRAGLGSGTSWNVQANSFPSPTSSPGLVGFNKHGLHNYPGGIRGSENYTGVVTL